MTRICTEGHEIEDGEDKCPEGHSPKASPPVVLSITQDDIQKIVQNAISGALQFQAAAQAAASAAAPQPNNIKTERPVIDIGLDEGSWAFFLEEWEEYKKRARLPAGQINSELRACCTTDLRRELFDFYGPGGMDIMSEEELLGNVRTLSVKGKNKSVHKQEFYAMKQAPLQPIQAFVTKLKSKAAHCDFTLKCSSVLCSHHVNSYADNMVCDQMIVGCNDKDIQEDVFAKDAQLPDFKSKFDLIQAIEEGKVAKSQLEPDSAVAASSAYQRQKHEKALPHTQGATPRKSHPSNLRTCSGCGSTDNGQGTNRPKHLHFPARDEQCSFCKLKGHLLICCLLVQHF